MAADGDLPENKQGRDERDGRSRVDRLNDLDLFSRSIAVIRTGSLFGALCSIGRGRLAL